MWCLCCEEDLEKGRKEGRREEEAKDTTVTHERTKSRVEREVQLI
jgi:hypothetical protein